MTGLVEWLRQTVAVEVLRDEVGPYATPGVAVPEYPWTVWVSNGDPDPRSWAGTLIARCRTDTDAGLVAVALGTLRDADPEAEKSEEWGHTQVWCVAYDGDTPSMDGTHPAHRVGEAGSRERAEAMLKVVKDRSARAPKRNLRIESRWVSDWVAEGGSGD